ncbi:hypothetical protein [Blastococcus sp. PRF04-17]|uniref:hypothetical protein n=1 Tax=Blastococcus sp. PRF04-17 TaxID=2933797 RepID=UPI001FF5B638|nr:hypothetical protein [Blastococcus sp. PRF04-17]UOY02013.1 hypothetical protein MVA48_01085 [Blastococcus sp. PRF04-17]
MPPALRRSLRVAVLVPLIALAACGGDDGAAEPAATSSAPESSEAGSSGAEETSAPELASGLLPADAFGPDASVVAVTAEQLQQSAVLAEADAAGVQVTPKDCSAAVAGAQPDFSDFDDVAAQAATVGTASVVEVLVRGGPVQEVFDQLAGAAERCPSAQVTSPQIGQAQLTFENLPVADLGDGAALLRNVTTVVLPDGTQATVPTLIAAALDGDRLVMLINVDTGAAVAGGTPAPAATDEFGALFEQAFEVQAAALD